MRQMRQGFAHAAMVRSDRDVRRLLPRIIVCNEKTRLSNKCDVVKCRLPRDVFVVRRKTGWRSAQAMVQMVHVSESWLRPRVAERLPILLPIGRCSDLSFALGKNRREHFGSERRCGALPLFKDGRWGR